ncbi:polyphosphate kinase [Magnetofaba australis]|uniref:Putative polyphosphate:AMP phosphotransferase n=1 Tax=Magnetofaba australis IT-1 TaxID=1434232 RepID=A0A1Y2K7N2_9PROT|nr:polyphosphate kinase [Magnetofaba australis]OSM05368.1 putative polyphosphate:AMP phosphotransferase [Magnetofaba australis IT-1]
MFETAELGQKISKKEYDAVAGAMRIEMLELQQRLRKFNLPVILVFAGVDGAGKSETVNTINEWMDPRWMVTHAYSEHSDVERERPEYWRYWRDLPTKGQFGMFLSSWYSQPVLDRVYKRTDEDKFENQLNRILAFEKMLCDDGALVIKFWMHLGKEAQRKRLKVLEKDPLQSWRITKTHWKHFEMYDRFIQVSERAIQRTSTGPAPWTLVEGADSRYRILKVMTVIRDLVTQHLDDTEVHLKAMAAAKAAEAKAAKAEAEAEAESKQEDEAETVDELVRRGREKVRGASVLANMDLTKALDKKSYKVELSREQARLNGLYRRAQARGISSLLVFEGADAAGKGGAIRRTTAAMDARDVRVIPIAAPSEEERRHHYLWRFWRHLSRAGKVTIFDRSWYGRVLVERVEGFATESEWRRAYAEINDFEEQLVQHGIVLVKYWIQISDEEQLARFKAREETPYKRWKLTDEDWRNRDKWGEYENAVNDMVERTSTHIAPWTLVEGNSKYYARVKVVRTYCDALEKALKNAG